MKRLPGRHLHRRPAPRADRGQGGEPPRDPGRRHRRHERRPGRARLHHPGQRRRDPLHPAAVPLVADAAIEGGQERASRAIEPEIEMPEEPTYDDVRGTPTSSSPPSPAAAPSASRRTRTTTCCPAARPPRPRRRTARRRRTSPRSSLARPRKPPIRARQDARLSGHSSASGRTDPGTDDHTAAGNPARKQNRSTGTAWLTSPRRGPRLRELTGAGMMDCKRALDRGRRRHRQGRRRPPRARPGRGRQEVRPRGTRGPHLAATSTPAAASAC